MKTTVELPAELLRQIKAQTALEGRSMKDLLIEAVQQRLARRPRSPGGWRAVFGRTTAARVRELDRRVEDLERIDLETWR